MNDNPKFIQFSNNEGKVWDMPIKHMRTALEIYQPSGLKGRLLVLLLPYLYWLPLFRNAIHLRRVNISLDKEVVEVIKRVLDIENFEFSIFEGTPSAHKKRVIQIFRGSKVIAYCKISNNKEVIKLLRNGKRVLGYLQNAGINNIPTCYYCDKISLRTDEVIFIQSTIKTNHSKTLHQFTFKHWELLENLHLNTLQKLRFEITDFANSLRSLEEYIDSHKPEYSNLILDKIKLVREYYGDGEVVFSAYHGDFAPWNMFLEKGELFLFDFEYARLTYPPYMDYFHYITQSNILENHRPSSEIVKIATEANYHIKDIRISYTAYLLDIISKYIEKDSGQLTSQSSEMIKIWVEILGEL
ncbi:MAG: hypothetical protein R3Y04_01545 [Rikenellaceae bacterium]